MMRSHNATGLPFGKGLVRLVVIALMAVGCTPSGDLGAETTTTAVGETTTTGGETTPETTSAGGGELTVAHDRTVVSLDAHGDQSTAPPTLMVNGHVFDTLVTYNGQIFEPSLATEWSNPDDRTWVFQLRDDVKFHDGQPLTAEDVAASLNRVMEVNIRMVDLWSEFESIEATGEYEVTLKTTVPLGTVLSNLTLLSIGPADQMNNEGFWNNPVGSGPFKLEEFTPDQRVVLVRNDDYWNGPPSLERVVIEEIPETATRMTALETGEIQLTWDIPPDQFQRLADNPDIETVTSAGFGYIFIWFNHQLEVFQDIRVRQALWHALDLEQIVADLFPGVGLVGRAPVPEPVFGWSENEPYTYDPDLARSLLAEAGYPDGFSATILAGANPPNIEDFVQVLISYWAEIGVNVEYIPQEQAEFIDAFFALEFDLVASGNSSITGDEDYIMSRFYTCEAFRMGLCDEELTDIINASRSAVDQNERLELFALANARMWEQAYAIWPVDTFGTYAWRKNVIGFEPPLDALPRFDTLSLEGG